jgi:hypothetical protein
MWRGLLRNVNDLRDRRWQNRIFLGAREHLAALTSTFNAITWRERREEVAIFVVQSRISNRARNIGAISIADTPFSDLDGEGWLLALINRVLRLTVRGNDLECWLCHGESSLGAGSRLCELTWMLRNRANTLRGYRLWSSYRYSPRWACNQMWYARTRPGSKTIERHRYIDI